MNIVGGLRLLKLTVLVAVPVLVPAAHALGERVGFRFEGALQGGSTGTYTLFGIAVPRNAPVAGTFTYDTTAPGMETEPAVRTFGQSIHGGYTLTINSDAIQLSASDYVVTVANDLQQTPEAADLISVDFDSRFNPTPAPILVNGIPWVGTVGFIKVELSWPSETFTDPDEPKLTSDRPLTPSPGVFAFVGSALTGTGASARIFSSPSFSISAIAPLAGDYNYNGIVDGGDYVEWHRAYGEASEDFLYADGNSDDIVDAADYTVWRDALGQSSLSLPTGQSVPEPSGLMLAVVGLIALVSRLRQSF